MALPLESSILFCMERTRVSSTSFSNTLVKALTSGMICDNEAASAEIFFVMSSIGYKILITLAAVCSCEGLSTDIDPSVPYAATAIFA